MDDVRSAPKLASPGDLLPCLDGAGYLVQGFWAAGQWSAKGLQNLKPFPYLASTASFSIWFVTASINNRRSRVSSWWIYDQISPGLLLNVCRALSLCWAPCVPGHCNVCCVCSPSSSFLALSLSFWGFSVWVWFGFILPFVFQTWGSLYWSSLTVVLRLLFV